MDFDIFQSFWHYQLLIFIAAKKKAKRLYKYEEF